MKKFLSVFKISFEQEFAYRINFIMWRVRNVMQIFLIFFLWDSVFSDSSRMVFGYDRSKILTYVFGILILRAIILSSKTAEVSGEISRGDLTNYLLKPINYFKYWFTRDIASKALNLSFATVETFILFLILKPPFFVQTNPLLILAFLLSVIIAILLFFYLLFMVNMVTFWMPENGWAAQFLLMVIVVESLSGGMFPLDILPIGIQKVLYLFPFPYLLFYPLQVYLGKITGWAVIKGLSISIAWIIVLAFGVNLMWKKGIKEYSAEGR